MNLFSHEHDENESEDFIDTEEFLATKDHSIQAQIELILSKFDFDKILKVFDVFEFRYAKKNSRDIIEYFSPDKDYLMDFAASLLSAAAEKGKMEDEEYIIASGGFEASFFPEDETLSLKWILEERETICDEPNELVYVI